MQYRNGHCYYTRSRRVNGKVQREYVSSGSMALVDAGFDEAERIEAWEAKRQEQERWQEEQEDAKALDVAVGLICNSAAAMFRAAMEEAGFHQHSRGEWRKKH